MCIGVLCGCHGGDFAKHEDFQAGVSAEPVLSMKSSCRFAGGEQSWDRSGAVLIDLNAAQRGVCGGFDWNPEGGLVAAMQPVSLDVFGVLFCELAKIDSLEVKIDGFSCFVNMLLNDRCQFFLCRNWLLIFEDILVVCSVSEYGSFIEQC